MERKIRYRTRTTREAKRSWLPLSAVYGAPLRLWAENQLGHKMVKWIESIEFIVNETQVSQGIGVRTRTKGISIFSPTFRMEINPLTSSAELLRADMSNCARATSKTSRNLSHNDRGKPILSQSFE